MQWISWFVQTIEGSSILKCILGPVHMGTPTFIQGNVQKNSWFLVRIFPEQITLIRRIADGSASGRPVSGWGYAYLIWKRQVRQSTTLFPCQLVVCRQKRYPRDPSITCHVHPLNRTWNPRLWEANHLPPPKMRELKLFGATISSVTPKWKERDAFWGNWCCEWSVGSMDRVKNLIEKYGNHQPVWQWQQCCSTMQLLSFYRGPSGKQGSGRICRWAIREKPKTYFFTHLLIVLWTQSVYLYLVRLVRLQYKDSIYCKYAQRSTGIPR